MTTKAHPGSHDFDFLFGRWHVAHRRLRKRLAACTQWDEFSGTSVATSLLNGLGNIDDNVLELPAGRYYAATLRAFDPSTQMWSIWWLDSRAPTHIEAPMRGRFDNGIGHFYADDQFEGKPIKVRFVWDAQNKEAPRWEQAFSPDGGATWETNWVMQFSRGD